jgi:hypothetical protein
MSKKKGKSRACKLAPKPPKASRAKKALNIALPVLTVVVLALVAYLVFFSNEPSTSTPTASTSTFTAPTVTRKAASLDELLKMTPEQLAGVDIAEMNLLCATGLPGAEDLDIDQRLATLDQWAQRVKFETERHLYRAHDPKWADHYRHSEAYLRAEFLVQVLYEDLGVRYNLAAKDNFDFDDSRVAFLHGMIPAKGQTVADAQGGTCASMPVMVTAVGRRLGYPLKLVTTNGHVFVRWDGQDHANPAWRERFNMEVINGFSSFSDDYYKTWPVKVTDAQIRANHYLISLTPAEELASFLAARGHCLIDNGRTKEAFDAYAAANRLAPKHPAYLAWARDAQRRLQPPTFARQGCREPPMVYRNDPMPDIEPINAINRANMRRMQPPMPGVP